MKIKKYGSGSFGPVFRGNVMKKEPNLFLREKPLEEIKYLGIGFFEWVGVISILSIILSLILKHL
tara:strand:+ start:1455 stop:1649 length:195 start_codon:yes stop_codon:yes gene_type:complete